ncbi:LacI family DNA-binding transcriptional regulator [Gracilibacillus sp. D59]|uniref:LacI family DNA-binding transcriptional regulator n=1 Tax=Gracilibacillus sp. D59 TaxID=3457434 RepID=UPI003FCE1DBE
MTKINSAEIAKLAGVSRSTVSRVINNYHNVPPETKEKVLRVIKDYNYYPKLHAQVMAGKKTGTIVLCIVDDGNISNDSTSNFLITRVIESAASAGYYVLTVVIRDINEAGAKTQIREIFHQKRVDGGIFIGVDLQEPLIAELITEGFIIGLFDYEKNIDAPNLLTYNFDDVNGSSVAVEHLIELNHKDIAILTGNMKRFSGMKRFEGYKEAMKKHGLQIRENWIAGGDFNSKAGYEGTKQIIQSATNIPTAIFASNDSVAFGAMKALGEMGLKVPEDISIIGVDDHLLSPFQKPALTTMRVDFNTMMQNLTFDVIRSINDETIEEPKLTNMELVVRESCRKI